MECLTIGLLVSRSCTRAPKFLGFTSSWVSYQQRPVILCQDILDLLLTCFIDVWRRKRGREGGREEGRKGGREGGRVEGGREEGGLREGKRERGREKVRTWVKTGGRRREE